MAGSLGHEASDSTPGPFPARPPLLLPLFSGVFFFFNSLMVGEYVGIYQSE